VIAAAYVNQEEELSRKKQLKPVGRAAIDIKDGGMHLPLGID
jgi:hypothetical protein